VSSIIKKSTSLAAAVAADSSKPKNGQPAQTETLMICIDTSGSMRAETAGAKSRMHAAISAAEALVDASSVLSHIGAIAFNDQVAETHGPETSRSRVREAFQAFHKHEGGTEFWKPIAESLARILKHQWGTVKRIIFLSDGEDMGDLYDLQRYVTQCAESKVIIDTVLFGDSTDGEKTLRMMSEKTGGIFCYAKDAASLRKTFLALEAGVRGLLGAGKK